MYTLLRSILFLFDPEWVHYFSMNTLRFFCQIPSFRFLIRSLFKATPIPTRSFGIEFRNLVGLGAGFDKNARYLEELECLGFGFVEIGTVTPLPQAGNDMPRLFRLPKDKALINRMGFNNDGAAKIRTRLDEFRKRNPKTTLIVGGNIGKNKATPNEEAWKDYEICFKALHPVVDYFVVNVSSPNTPGLRELQEKESLRKILTHLQMINNAKAKARPILLKIAPDLTPEQINDVVSLALEIKLDGLVATNTTISRDGLITPQEQIEKIGAGGLSGKPLTKKSTTVVDQIHATTNSLVPIIASGGIFNGEDAEEKLNAGAQLVQVWTGFIYEGPSISKKICKYLNVTKGKY